MRNKWKNFIDENGKRLEDLDFIGISFQLHFTTLVHIHYYSTKFPNSVKSCAQKENPIFGEIHHFSFYSTNI